MIDANKRSPRTAIAAAIAALLAGTALLSLSPPPAAAARHPCPEEAFCLYFNDDANGGRFDFGDSDPNLDNDKYVGGDEGETVGDTARFAWNNGTEALRDDVVIYGLPRYHGADACVRLRTGGTLPRNWWNNIESYRWATDSQCESAGVIPLPALAPGTIPGA